MKMRLDAVVIILSIVFIYGLGLANKGVLDLGPYSEMVLILVYFSIFSWYDQYRRSHMERNYILIFSLVGIYIGAALGYLISRTWDGVIIGAGAALLVSLAILIPLRKKFYAWLDQIMSHNE